MYSGVFARTIHISRYSVLPMRWIIGDIHGMLRPLEALVSENETPVGLQRMVGIYNVIWAGTGALAYFSGGAMLDKLGMKSLFYVPAAILAIQLLITLRLESNERIATRRPGAPAGPSARPRSSPPAPAARSATRAG